MTLGIFSYFGYELDLPRRLRLIREAGFDRTSIWWGPLEEMVAGGQQDAIPAMVRGEGLAIENLHAPFEACNDLWSPSQAVRDGFLDRHRRWLDDCARHDIGCMVLHVTHGRGAPDPNAGGVETFSRLTQLAESAGVVLAVENTRRDDVVHCLLENIESPWLKFCYDSSHDWLWGHPRLGTLARWGHRLAQTHLSDCGNDADRHLLPGDGAVEWTRLAEVFPRNSYRGCLMLEVMPPGLDRFASPAAFLTHAKGRLEWLAQVIQSGQSSPPG